MKSYITLLHTLVLIAVCISVQGQSKRMSGKIESTWYGPEGNQISFREYNELWVTGYYIANQVIDSSSFKITSTLKLATEEELNDQITSAIERIGVKDLIGKSFPEITLTDIDGKTYSLEDFKDKVVVINTWFVGCPNCELEKESLNQLYQDYSANEKVLFLSFSKSSLSKSIKYAEKKDFNWPIIIYNKEIKKSFNIYAYPINYVLKNGEYALVMQGLWPGHIPAIRREIDSFLN